MLKTDEKGANKGSNIHNVRIIVKKGRKKARQSGEKSLGNRNVEGALSFVNERYNRSGQREPMVREL